MVLLLAAGSSIGVLTGSRVINSPRSGWPSLVGPLLRHIPAASLAKRRARRGVPVGPWTQGWGSSHSPGVWAREAAPLSVVALSLRNWTLACPDRRNTCMEYIEDQEPSVAASHTHKSVRVPLGALATFSSLAAGGERSGAAVRAWCKLWCSASMSCIPKKSMYSAGQRTGLCLHANVNSGWKHALQHSQADVGVDE